MSGAKGFSTVVWAACAAGAALSCYLVSLRVASERAALEDVENRIVLAQRDIRVLQTEIGTRGRLAQLERWNARVIRLSAPSADQFVQSGFQLATMVAPERKPAIAAPVVLASAPVEPDAPKANAIDAPPVTDGDDGRPGNEPLGGLMHRASYERPTAKIEAAPARPKAGTTATAEPAAKPVNKPVKGTASTVTTKPVKTAAADPLAPLPGAGKSAKEHVGDSPAKPGARPGFVKSKDPGSRQ